MIRNYIFIALRNIKTQFSYSAINILGLALGMSCSLVIFLFLHGELSYDRAFPNHNRIYRVSTSWFNIGNFASGQEQLNQYVQKFAEVETTTRIKRLREVKMTSDKLKQVRELVVYGVDSTFFQVFEYPFLAGNPTTCLQESNSIVMTESMALKYFGTTDAVGQSIELGDSHDLYQVTAIVRNPLFNSHLKSEIWIRFKPTSNTTWAQASVYNYVKLREGYDTTALNRTLASIVESQAYPQLGNGMSLEEWSHSDNAVKLFALSLTDVYLKSDLKFEISPGGNEMNIYIFGAVAFLIIILAIVNFINLTTARSAKRAKEIGLRKTLGTTRESLVLQFLIEAVITSLIAMVVALILSEGVLGIYYQIMHEQLTPKLITWEHVLIAVGFSIVVGILAGLYPAFYLTRFQPAKVLKGNYQSMGGKARFRNALVIFQFSMSITLILSAIAVILQLQFMSSKDLGFDQTNLLTIENIGTLGNKRDGLRNQLDKLSQVESSTFVSPAPASQGIMIYTYRTPAMQEDVTMNTMVTDEKLLETLDVKLIQGRNFDPRVDTDTTAAIINETALRELMVSDTPIGNEINKGMKIIGVVRDFHFQSPTEKIAPLVMIFRPQGGSLSIKLTGKANDFLTDLQSEWSQLSPDEPIKYSFMDQNFESLLAKEKAFAKIITFFTGLAIFISCLGLFGLSVFTAQQRIKEIAIRKVCGASTISIITLLNKNFSLLVVISIVISVPISGYIINQWLRGFPYQTEIQPWIYGVGALSALVLSWITVGFNSYRTAITDPAKTLKNE